VSGSYSICFPLLEASMDGTLLVIFLLGVIYELAKKDGINIKTKS
jgi:hypothetical protein